MYFPSSQIETDLHTEGGFLRYVSTQEEYAGNYFRTSTGKFYTGKNPKDTPTVELELIPNQSEEYFEINNQPELIPETLVDEFNPNDSDTPPGNYSFFTLPENYTRVSKLSFGVNPLPPLSTYPTPTESDYEFGVLQRYFLRKINEPIFLEVDKFTYDKYRDKDKNVMYKLYFPFSFTWEITGNNRDKAATINKNILTLKEKRLGIPGLVNYFKGKYDEFYKSPDIEENLYTDGTEYKIRGTGQVYKGPYHIHPDKGPMVGAKHIRRKHDYLDPITQAPTTGSSTYTPPTPEMGGSFGGGGGGY